MSKPAFPISPVAASHVTKIAEIGHAIENTFSTFGTPLTLHEVDVTADHVSFYFTPQTPTRMITIQEFEDDVRFALARDRVEIEAPVPNTRTIAVHVYLNVARDIFNLEEPAGVLSPWTNVDDELFFQAAQLVTQYHKPYTSFLQARLKVGYERAAHLLELMEERGIIAPRGDRHRSNADDSEDSL